MTTGSPLQDIRREPRVLENKEVAGIPQREDLMVVKKTEELI